MDISRMSCPPQTGASVFLISIRINHEDSRSTRSVTSDLTSRQSGTSLGSPFRPWSPDPGELDKGDAIPRSSQGFLKVHIGTNKSGSPSRVPMPRDNPSAWMPRLDLTDPSFRDQDWSATVSAAACRLRSPPPKQNKEKAT